MDLNYTGSLIGRVFFSSKYSVICHSQFYRGCRTTYRRTTDMEELHIWRDDYKILCDFPLLRKVMPLTCRLFKGWLELMIATMMMMIKKKERKSTGQEGNEERWKRSSGHTSTCCSIKKYVLTSWVLLPYNSTSSSPSLLTGAAGDTSALSAWPPCQPCGYSKEAHSPLLAPTAAGSCTPFFRCVRKHGF